MVLVVVLVTAPFTIVERFNISYFKHFYDVPAPNSNTLNIYAVFLGFESNFFMSRNCKSKEAEVKRINKELANIRSKFKVR